MAGFDEKLEDIAAQLEREDPDFARALAGGRPCRPREDRRRRAWLALTVSLTGLGIGIAIGHGLLIAAGLAAVGCAVHLLPPPAEESEAPEGPERPERPEGSEPPDAP
ncbi:DUF3040 domain-containing protein [Streptomyces sp. NPDC048172]|uniref:DUF3040 domain-containing protein n=1 Tax=Streptomyces sp. NPDC048172 TaxID=3365505 RepID=UPI00371F2106